MYRNALARYPFATQAITTGFLFSLGDLISQVGIEQTPLDSYDVKRTRRLGGFGLFLAGPAMITWYRFLNLKVVIANPQKALLTRVAMDQLLFAPTFMAIFFTYNGYMEGEDWEGIKNRLRKGYPSALVGNYTLWPAVQLVNFKYVPLNYQANVVNTVALGWNTYMSYLNKKSSKKIDS
ncbi:hypothetical protein BC833DRAFT_594093 [Globomyces pollinis-pini]|nr:hypothetical protein BC833DRAFT_594093 [Globomyces pollinis-pini]